MLIIFRLVSPQELVAQTVKLIYATGLLLFVDAHQDQGQLERFLFCKIFLTFYSLFLLLLAYGY